MGMIPFPLLPLSLLLSLAQSESASTTATGALLDQRELQVACARLAGEFPREVSLVPLYESPQGRRVDALRVARGELTPGRPAVLVVAAIDGPQAWTSTLALEAVRGLLTATDPATKALLSSTTFWIVPRANPDACEVRFTQPLSESRATLPAALSSGDDDRDGTSGEDTPSDLDGNGLITLLRISDPAGEWIVDPRDTRAMRKADRARGEQGAWRVMPEGRDSDRDRASGEDPQLDLVVNRNFPQGWREHTLEGGAWPTAMAESKALCDFVLAHPELAAVVVYGDWDNCAERQKTRDEAARRSSLPSEGVPTSDADAHALTIQRSGAQLVGQASGGDHGTFQAWLQASRGLWTFAVAPWSMPTDVAAPETDSAAGKPAPAEPSLEAKRLRWIDREKETARFVPWRRFQHPDLGPVEIGGFAPFALIEPPQAERARLAGEQTKLLAGVAQALPRVRAASFTAKDLGNGLLQVDLVLQNDSILPYRSALGVRTNAVRPIRLTLELPDDADRLAGPVEQLIGNLDGLGGRQEVRWLVRGCDPEDLVVLIDTPHAGAMRIEMEVQ